MSKILYVSDELHQNLKFLATKLGITMQTATDEAVQNWVQSRENEEKQKEILLGRISQKLSVDEKRLLEAILKNQNH
ncbi:hypothetical protein HP1_111 [Candidatus Termititenax spirochaetophilus]|uniref:Uncharacterized protein n=1 Tax=Candidatus Termititenax spirochaetophilus TaxID=2218522 RepID=A0A388T7U0_9BACT|nr:hypothetical protein HP1_111 [Candidatus Termititenax spirochaetophilus]